VCSSDLETWEQIGFWANSLIFFLVGILVPKVLKDFTGEQAVWLVVMLAVAFTARFFVLFVVLPAMTRTRFAHTVSASFRLIMFWGGLRGAVSLALALVVAETAGVDESIKNFIVVLVTCFVLFTLFINATTIRSLMSVLGLNKLSPAEIAIRDRVLALSIGDIKEQIGSFADEEKISPDLARNMSQDYDKRLGVLESQMADSTLAQEDRIKIGLGTLVNRERQIYMKRFSDGVASDDITRALLASVDTLEDGFKDSGLSGYDEAMRGRLGFDRGFRFAMYLQRKFGMEGRLADQLAERFDVLIATQSAIRELTPYTKSKLSPLIGDDAAAALVDELAKRIGLTEAALDALKLQYPEYFDAIQRCHLGRIAVRLEDLSYRRMLSEQMISPEVFEDLQNELTRRTNELEAMPSLDLGLEPDKLVAKVPFFENLDQARVREIAAQLRPRLVLPGEKVVKQGDAGDAMYFISTGAVQVEVGDKPIRLGSGDFFGEIALVREPPRTADVTALGYCQVLALYHRDFAKLMASYPDLKQIIERVAEERLES